MSAVTKVLIIVLVVLCVAFSMTAISFVASSANWKALAEEYLNEAQIADAHQRNLMAAHAAELASARDTMRNLRDRINQLEADLQDATEQTAHQAGEIAQLQSDNRQADALSQRLTNELGIAQAGRAAVQSQRKELESRNIVLEKRNVDLNERVNELTTRVTVLVQQQRHQAQQMSILRSENQKLAQQAGEPIAGGAEAVPGAGMRGVKPLSGAPVPRISGHVVAVDGDFVTISVGSADQVKKGAIFVIFREGSTYIGDIEITDVEPNLSAGRIIRSVPGVAPRKGDQVQDEYQFLSPR